MVHHQREAITLGVGVTCEYGTLLERTVTLANVVGTGNAVRGGIIPILQLGKGDQKVT